MPRRSSLSLSDVADINNLTLAFARSAKSKRRRPEVLQFERRLSTHLNQLGEEIRELSVPVGKFLQFKIFDPKPRVIHAPCFRERVLHHAMMAKMGPILDRSMVDDSFACRAGKGGLAAVHRAEHHLRRYPFFVKIDIRKYFDSINHKCLLKQVERRFKNQGLLALCRRVIGGYQTIPNRGLPIGALTSQYFANVYLTPLDRFLLEEIKVLGMVRYMDDVAWWVMDLTHAKKSLQAATEFIREQLQLRLHPRSYIQRSTRGLGFLGYRLYPGCRRLSARRRRRYLRARHDWEAAYRGGLISASTLQRGYEGALAAIVHADSIDLRKADLMHQPSVDA